MAVPPSEIRLAELAPAELDRLLAEEPEPLWRAVGAYVAGTVRKLLSTTTRPDVIDDVVAGAVSELFEGSIRRWDSGRLTSFLAGVAHHHVQRLLRPRRTATTGMPLELGSRDDPRDPARWAETRNESARVGAFLRARAAAEPRTALFLAAAELFARGTAPGESDAQARARAIETIYGASRPAADEGEDALTRRRRADADRKRFEEERRRLKQAYRFWSPPRPTPAAETPNEDASEREEPVS